MSCPICGCMEYEKFKKINCGKLDGSNIYRYVKILECKVCGHHYNKITPKKLEGLMSYYEDEYSVKNLHSGSVGDRPGSENKLSVSRYEKMFSVVAPYITEYSKILDVGCATGGFLNFLKKKGFKNLHGIEMIEKYVEHADRRNIQLGNVYDIPFEDNSIDLIVLDQVLEHLEKPQKAIKEIKRVLTENGFVCIGVPDRERYNISFFEDYFYLLREHIQHFNLDCLVGLMRDFKFINHLEVDIPMLSEKALLPNLICLFKNSNEQQKITVCYGIGREFLYLYENTELRLRDLILVDDVVFGCSVNNMFIHSSNILKSLPKESELYVTALAHKDVLESKAREVGFKGEICSIK